MKSVDLFFEKSINNKVLVECFEKLKGDIWWELSFKERVVLFETIMKEFMDFYPELGKSDFEFAFLGEHTGGEEDKNGTRVNVKWLEEGNYFEILAICLHELRHFYQRSACELYGKRGIIHELFTKEEIESFSENLERSALFLKSNYIQAGDTTGVEYNLQPIEYDAEYFSYDFMRKFSKKFLTDEFDIMYLEAVYLKFLTIIKLHDGDKNNIIDFSKIYHYNYIDMIKNNRVSSKQEQKIYEKCMKLLKKLPNLDNQQIFMLLNPCFMGKYDAKTKVDLLNAYLLNSGSGKEIVYDEGKYYFNGLLFDEEEADIFALIEPIFLEVAKEKVKSIVEKDHSEVLFGFEKEIRLNLAKEENMIKEDKNPLFYRLQPYVLYINSFMKNEYFLLVRGIDQVYDSYNSYLEDFLKYIKKYDNDPVIEKVEILTGKKFEEIYSEIVNRMSADLSVTRKASK